MKKPLVVNLYQKIKCRKCYEVWNIMIICLNQGEGQSIHKSNGNGTVQNFHYYCPCGQKEAILFFEGESQELRVNEEFAHPI